MEKPEFYENLEPIALAYYQAGCDIPDLHADMKPKWDLHVLYSFNKNDNYYYVHCLDMDLIAYASVESQAELRLMDMIQGHMSSALEEKRFEHLMDYPADDSILLYYHNLKMEYYRKQGGVIDKIISKIKDYDLHKKRRMVTQKLEEDIILVEKIQEWRIAI
ncbi:MAG: hypothetical protein L6Q54_06345 [Leptospiraceae bacterium]|nr:hypothetical protein [Leptospiraceae bacterium]MCK6380856.1 hypothetical protein [Leptospiraceae bacterium]